MKLRDIIALPFLLTALIFDTVAIRIGGEWTARTYLLTPASQDNPKE